MTLESTRLFFGLVFAFTFFLILFLIPFMNFRIEISEALPNDKGRIVIARVNAQGYLYVVQRNLGSLARVTDYNSYQRFKIGDKIGFSSYDSKTDTYIKAWLIKRG